MSSHLFHMALSAPRFNRYLAACDSDEDRAIKLYKLNLEISQKMYAVLGIFEVLLRNMIDRHFVLLKGETWIESAVAPGGYLDNPNCFDSFHAVQDAIHKLGLGYTHDRLIAKLTFGFWTYQFAEKEFAASGSNLLDIFIERPHGTRQKFIFQSLFKVNDLRNRIAHYEPICFDKNTSKVSTLRTQRRYDLIKTLFIWLGYNPNELLKGIDEVEQVLLKINEVST